MSRYDKDVRSTEGNSGNFVTLLIWVAGGAIFLLFLWFIFFYNPIKRDPVTNCTDDPGKHLVVLIDLSDALQSRQIESLSNRFTQIAAGADIRGGLALKKGDKLSVYFVTESDRPERVFHACSPGTIAEKDKTGEGLSFVASRWNSFTHDMLGEVEGRLNEVNPLSRSPIIESIAFVRAAEFPPSDHINSKTQKLALVVASDLLQNSALLSHYNEDPIPDPLSLHKRYPVSLRGVESSILFIVSPTHQNLQNAEMKAWWRKYFSGNVTGGELVSWSNL